MKEFRNWWESHKASVSPHTCQSARGENLACLADEEVWKAALKWVKGKLKYEICPGDIEYFIDKELNNE